MIASSYKYDLTDAVTFFGDVRFARVESSHIWSAPRTYGSSHAVQQGGPWVTPEMEALNGGDKVPARIPSKAIEDAPGSYVMLRLK